jgi:hypothetical protein
MESIIAKSEHNNQIIKQLKNQIELIKIASSPEAMRERIDNLKIENDDLKKKVESLVKELEIIETQNLKSSSNKITTKPVVENKKSQKSKS